MRRAPLVLTTTVLGTAGVLAFKPHEPSIAAMASAAADSAAPDSTASTATTPSTTTASGSTASSTAATSGTSPSAASSSTGSAAKTATGDSIATQYGPVQVRVTVAGGKITKVVPLALTGNEPKSTQISAQAAPILLQSVLTKQTAAIDAVSGATVTSAGYEASLQSALDKLGFKAADGTRGSSTIPQVEEHDGPGGGFR